MEKRVVTQLEPEEQVPWHVMHESGELLLSAGADLSRTHLRLLGEVGIEEVYLLDRYDNVIQFALSQRNRFILTDELKPHHRICGPIAVNDRLVVRHDSRVDASLKETLKDLGIYTVAVRKTEVELRSDQVRSFRRMFEAVDARLERISRPASSRSRRQTSSQLIPSV